MLDAGTYRAKAAEAALGETETGKEQIAVRFDLLDLEGQSITWFGYFTEKTTESTIKALRTAGWKGSDLMDLSDLCNPETTPEVHLVVEHESYTNPQTGQTKVQAKVRWVNGSGGLALKKALDPNKAKAFAARMKAQVAAYDRSAGTPAPKAKPQQRRPADGPPMEHLEQQSGGAPGGEDDIPFAPFSNI
jgi:hypothetical protein